MCRFFNEKSVSLHHFEDTDVGLVQEICDNFRFPEELDLSYGVELEVKLFQGESEYFLAVRPFHAKGDFREEDFVPSILALFRTFINICNRNP